MVEKTGRSLHDVELSRWQYYKTVSSLYTQCEMWNMKGGFTAD